MTFLTLFSDEQSWLATDQRVFNSAELTAVTDVVEKAQQLSAQIVANAEQAAQAVREGAESGYLEGQHRAALEAKTQSAATLLQLHEQFDHELAQQRQACASLAIDIVKKIAANVAPEDWLHAQAMQAAAELIDQPSIVIRVNTSRVDSVRALCKAEGKIRFDDVIGDGTVGIDACVLETSLGKIDVDLDTQLTQIRHLLVDGELSDG